MNSSNDVAKNDLYKINGHILEAVRRGEPIRIEDSHAFQWRDFAQEPLYCHPNVMFELFEGVFEVYPVEYVRSLVDFDSRLAASTFWWCAQFWQRTRDLQRSWPKQVVS